MPSHEERLQALGIELPPPAVPKGVYRNVIVTGNIVATSGHLPSDESGNLIVGKVGVDLDLDAGFAAARSAGLAILTSLREELGTLDRVVRLVKVLGFVNCEPDFTMQPAVINGCSELFRDVFGQEEGVGIRSAVGVASLPLGVPVELEAMVEITG